MVTGSFSDAPARRPRVSGALPLPLLARFRREIARTPFLLLALGLISPGSSAAIDLGECVIPGIETATPWMATTLSMVEELAKLGGIVLMTGYAMTTVMARLRAAHPGEPGYDHPKDHDCPGLSSGSSGRL